jgi:peptidoglycan/LPS O-acetylase OafA/YrhL
MQRMAYLDGLRGLAALDVVITHFAAIFYPFALFGASYPRHHVGEEYFWQTPLGLLVSGRFAVCLFFVLSAFVLSLRYLGVVAAGNPDLGASIAKRTFRLAGLLLTTATLGYVLMCADLFFNNEVAAVTGSSPWFSHMWATDLSLGAFLHILVFDAFSKTDVLNPPLWTIGYELYGSFLTFGLLLFFRKTRLRFIAYAAALVLLQGSYYQCFVLGLFLADIYQNVSGAREWLSRPAVGASFLIAGLLLAGSPAYLPPEALDQSAYGFLPQLDMLGGGYSTLGAVLVLLGTIGSAWLHRFLTRPAIAFLGTISFALYSSHMLVQGSFTSWLFLLLLERVGYDGSALLATMASLVVMFPAAWLLWRWVDVPAIRLSSWVGVQFLARVQSKSKA